MGVTVISQSCNQEIPLFTYLIPLIIIRFVLTANYSYRINLALILKGAIVLSKEPNRRLTGDDVKVIRKALKESQAEFGKRLDVSQPVIVRLEKKGEMEVSGPEKILILQIAKANKIVF